MTSALIFFVGVGIVYDRASLLGLFVGLIGAPFHLVWVLATSIVLLRRLQSRSYQAESRVEMPA